MRLKLEASSAPRWGVGGEGGGRAKSRGGPISPAARATTLSGRSALPATSHEAARAASSVGTPEMIRKPTTPDRFDCGTRVDWPVTTNPPANGSAYRRSPPPPGIASVANEPRAAAAWLRSPGGNCRGEPFSCAGEQTNDPAGATPSTETWGLVLRCTGARGGL